jgi:hypothetical protein
MGLICIHLDENCLARDQNNHCLATNGPCNDEIKNNHIVNESIGLRDYFAAQALIGIMQRFAEPGYSDVEAVGEAFYVADLMMALHEDPALNPGAMTKK